MLLTCTSGQLAWTSTPSDRLDTTYKCLHHTAAIRNWEGGGGTRTFKIQTLKILLETNHRQLSVICILCYNHQGSHYWCCVTPFGIFLKSLNFFHVNWIPKIIVNFCYLRIYYYLDIETVSCCLLQWMTRMAMECSLKMLGQLFQVLMPAKIISKWNLFGIFLCTCKTILHG